MREIEEMMHNRKYDVLNKISKIVHPKYAEDFAKILHYAWQEELPEAKKISEKLDLWPIDFVATMEDEEEFRELIRNELEEMYVENYG